MKSYHCLVLILCVFAISCQEEKEQNVSNVNDMHLPNLDVLFEDYGNLDDPSQFQSFANDIYHSNRDLKASEMYIYAALFYNQASIPDSTVVMLNLAIDNGMSNPNILSKFKIEGDSIYDSVQVRLDSIQNQLKSIDNFGIETSAMQEFWSYLDRAQSDTTHAKTILKEFIFDGPKELRDYYTIRYANLDNMKFQMIDKTPEYYAHLKTQFQADSIKAMKTQIKGWMKNFKTLYAEAVFPKVYVVPGLLNSGGTASEMGMFIGGDMFGKSKTMRIDGMTEWQQGAIAELDGLPKLVIHELMHFQQNYGDQTNDQNVLGSIFMEGVCDFMVELATGIKFETESTTFLEHPEHMQLVSDDFLIDRYTTDFSKWLYNGDIEDRPYDLGYTLGYLISKSYYEHHANKTEAIYDLLNTDDYTSIYKNSDFAYLLD
ncbi:MAG: DUF2268 domain-containing putative Zn-dependent protease [Psychroserpens sp.]|uniref:DUF2268 domain-containing putative Zn-dependent protease n=1 Tax=Psychroserpens sp. TaxID=2020870 RepID=UPI003C77EB01